MSNRSEVEIAWIAGLIEGEGTFYIQKDHSLRVAVGMTDRDVIDRLNQLVPGNIWIEHRAGTDHPEWKDLYRWYIGKRSVILELLLEILPLMGARRSAKIQELIDHAKEFPPDRDRANKAKHGTVSMSSQGCKCEECRLAQNLYRREYYWRKKRESEESLDE